MEMNEKPSNIEDKDKIAVLLAEYNTLRTETQHRLSLLIQSTAVGVTVLIALGGLAVTRPETRGLYWLFAVATFIYMGALVLIDVNLRQLTKRLRELERRINKLANARLLSWQTDFGWGGAFPRSRKRLRKLDGLDG